MQPHKSSHACADSWTKYKAQEAVQTFVQSTKYKMVVQNGSQRLQSDQPDALIGSLPPPTRPSTLGVNRNLCLFHHYWEAGHTTAQNDWIDYCILNILISWCTFLPVDTVLMGRLHITTWRKVSDLYFLSAERFNLWQYFFLVFPTFKDEGFGRTGRYFSNCR